MNEARRIARDAAPAIPASVALMEAVSGLDEAAKTHAEAAFRLDQGRRYPNGTVLNGVWKPAVRGAIAPSGAAMRNARPMPSPNSAKSWVSIRICSPAP